MLAFLYEAGKAAELMAETGEEPIPMTVGLAVFEAPRDTKKQP